MQINDPIKPPSEVAPELGLSAAFEQALMRALAKDRDQRFQSMGELVSALEETAGDLPASVARKASRPAQAEPAVAGPQEPTLSPARGQPAPPVASDTIPEPEPPAHLPGDPMFIGRGRPETLRRFDDPVALDTDLAPRRSRAPVWLLLAALTIGSAGLAALLLRGADDAPAVVIGPADAGPMIARFDAGAPPDAGVAALAPPPDASPEPRKVGRSGKRRGSTRIVPRAPAGWVSIVVETRPRGGTLVMSNGAYGGTDGTTLTRRGGEKIVVDCKLAGYLPGRTELIFDGVTDVAICQMTRLKKCIPGVKNPFDDCTESPRIRP